ncbi:MAG: heparinase II/III family protein [Verrucomicrobiota bacterium]
MRALRLWVVVLVSFAVISPAAFAATNAAPDLLATLRPGHPRLIADPSSWAAIQNRARTDPVFAALLARMQQDGRKLLAQPPVTYQKTGRRLLSVSREALRRIALLAFEYRVTGDRQFLSRAEAEMIDVCGFADWNPSHFLDVAEMTAGVAIGYDWLYDALSPATRDIVRRAILEKALQPGGLDPASKFSSWQKSENNWNQVCFGGMTLGALAIADEEPDAARAMLAMVRAGNPRGQAPYAPDGVYPEGPSYWDYGTGYEALLLSALQSGLGTDWGLANAPGFLASAQAQIEVTGPTGRPYNFSDGRDAPQFKPALFWFAHRLRQPDLLIFQWPRLNEIIAGRSFGDEGRFLPMVALWWDGVPPTGPVPFPLDWFGNGSQPVAVFRGSWTDTNTLFLGLKGGSASGNHAHMDGGSFVLESDGVRWAVDIGLQEYESIESKGWNLWDRKQNSDRWRVFRLNNFSHNTLTLGGRLHNVSGDARITRFVPIRDLTIAATARDRDFTTAAAGGGPGIAVVDLSTLFTNEARRVVRTFEFSPGRSVTVRDELSGLAPRLAVRWTMATRARIRLEGSRAILDQNGRALEATVRSPAGARFDAVPADPPADGVNAANPNTRLLRVDLAAPQNGNLEIEVVLRPVTRP